MTLNTGDRAPDFEATMDNGEKFRLSDFIKDHALVLYFYPKDETPGCTKEACVFRDNFTSLKEVGGEVIGVSADSQESHAKFREHHNLQFRLISDPGNRIRELFKLKHFLIPQRITFVIDQSGTIRGVFESQIHPAAHAEFAHKILQEIRKSAEGKAVA